MASEATSAVSVNSPSPKGNKTLVTVLIILGGIFLLCACCGIVFFAVGSSSSSTSLNTTSSNSSITGQSSPNESSVSSQAAIKTNKIGDLVTVDSFQIKVLSVENLGSTVNQKYLGPIKTEGKFIKVNFEVENIKNESRYLGSMQIVDDKGRKFDESDKKFSILGDTATFLEKLNPNVKAKYSTVFDVSSDAKALKFKVDGAGIFNIDSVLIELGINAN